MAKQKPSLGFDDDALGMASGAGEVAVLEQPKAPEAVQPATPKWMVSLNCPTPLAHRVLEVEANTQEEAKAKFLAANGISDSRHPFTVTRVL